MRRALLLAVLPLLGCDDTITCNLLAFWDSFEIIVEDDDWQRDDYKILVTYADHRYQCDVRVPAVERGLDGGVSVVSTRDAGEFLPTNEVVPCTVIEEPAHTFARAEVEIGRALVLRFEGSPSRVKLTIDGANGRVLERELRPSYEESTPGGGPECGIQRTGVVRVELP